MNILDEIIAHKYKEVEESKSLFPVKLLEKSLYFGSQTVSLKKYVTREDKSGIIAEIKRKSPSKGVINAHVDVERTSIGYMQAGASALSVLTDKQYFGGSNEDLTKARKFNFCPILRKDFVVDEYQIVEAKSIGADAILLIAAALEPQKLKQLAEFAQSLDLEVLLEVHNQAELDNALNENVDLVGVNNRDLKSFEVNINTSIELSSAIPSEFVKVSESGIHDPETITKLKTHGFDGFLIGERFMATGRPDRSCGRFIEALSKLEDKSYV
ncbi:indole-3-glycerol phosphate synthase TrpC [Fulvivirga sp. RKSG066]|uniref:indole-3-glycerol phosphate synthase TrpC n=1 Tax=Fulvivirga aurantia TaxID=2529383 RepID=UPI0012BB95DD|nr:indole-3-glycerol phosphate synthase TrpC [Fulvivirga aurantia]MTI20418.1 indole-3-glycerol phosphate synthase TrpC [Fulvivirga aurantia]